MRIILHLLTQVENIRDATNKSWVLDNDHFRHKIEKQLGRSLSPAAKGGDRKSVQYREQLKIIESDTFY